MWQEHGRHRQPQPVEPSQRRQAKRPEFQSGSRYACFGGQLLEVFWSVTEREAPVPDAVFVPALETLPCISKENRTRSHQFARHRRAVLKGTRSYAGDAKALSPRLETPVPRTGRADTLV